MSEMSKLSVHIYFFLSISKLFALFFFFFETAMIDLTHSFVDSFRTVFVTLIFWSFIMISLCVNLVFKLILLNTDRLFQSEGSSL